MADSTTNLDTISVAVVQKEVIANDLFDAGSPATSFGRRASTSAGLTWGYYGGIAKLDAGTLLQVANGTKTLTNGATNYIELNTATGAVDLNTSAWTGSTKKRLYKVVTSGSVVTSYEDWRVGGTGATAAAVGDVVGPASAADGVLALFDGTTGKLIKVGGAAPTGTNTGNETAASIATIGHAATTKAAMIDADEINLLDSADSWALKRATFTNLKAFLKTYFDTLYAALTQPVVGAGFYPGAPSASALVMLFAAPSSITTVSYASAIAGSSGKALTAATAQTDFDVRKNATTAANGTSVGTIRFAAAGTVPTFIAASPFSLTGGTDWLTVWAPGTPDATLADIGISLYGTR